MSGEGLHHNYLDEEFTLEELIEEQDRLLNHGGIVDYKALLELVDKFIHLGEDEASDEILKPAIDICNYLLYRGSKLGYAYYRLSKCYFLLGRYSLARQHLTQSLDEYLDDDTKEEVLEFQEVLIAKVTRDGKIGIAMIGGILSAAFFWWLSSKRNQAASGASDSGK